jgi:glutathione synthase/RimK-type ligase-like ATP-grasp enzyme
MDYGGVDIICDQAGSYSVIEVNSIPAWKGLQSVCGLDIADLLVEDLLQRNQVMPPEQQHTALCS